MSPEICKMHSSYRFSAAYESMDSPGPSPVHKSHGGLHHWLIEHGADNFRMPVGSLDLSF